MPKPTKDVRGFAKAQRENDRQDRKAQKLAKRREARERQPEPERAGEAPQQPGKVQQCG